MLWFCSGWVLLATIKGTQCMQKRWHSTAISKILSGKLENKQSNRSLNVRHGSPCGLFLFLSHKFVGAFTPRRLHVWLLQCSSLIQVQFHQDFSPQKRLVQTFHLSYKAIQCSDNVISRSEKTAFIFFRARGCVFASSRQYELLSTSSLANDCGLWEPHRCHRSSLTSLKTGQQNFSFSQACFLWLC